jgi:hypothetical protein
VRTGVSPGHWQPSGAKGCVLTTSSGPAHGRDAVACGRGMPTTHRRQGGLTVTVVRPRARLGRCGRPVWRRARPARPPAPGRRPGRQVKRGATRAVHWIWSALGGQLGGCPAGDGEALSGRLPTEGGVRGGLLLRSLLAATRQLGCLLSRSQRRLVIPVPLPCKRPLGGRVRGRLTPWCDVAIAPGLPHLAFGGRPPGVLAFVVGLGLGDGGHAGRFMAASMGPSTSARASLDMVASGRSTDAARTDWLLSGDGWPRASCHQPRATHDRRRRRGGRVWASASWWD